VPPTDKDDERVSLAPLTPEEALRALLKVNPDDEDREDRDDDADEDEADSSETQMRP
jgi:hypothetical protein